MPKCALHAVHILKPKLHKVFNAVVLLLVEPVHINIRNKMFPIPLCKPTGFAVLPPSHKKMHNQQNVLHSKHIIMIWAVISPCIIHPPLFWQQ